MSYETKETKLESFSIPAENASQGVECLGKIFENDEKRREYFTEILRKMLKDPKFRETAGFPIGTDEDILTLSDPPYYTACPNPFISDFLNSTTRSKSSKNHNNLVPFATDVSGGKGDPIYKVHTYHTKVPQLAILRYILHFTNPGDVVFDGFCGSGMTGVAAQLCGDPKAIENIECKISENGEIIDKNNENIGKFGIRTAILNDLSPVATHISAGYNLTKSPLSFQQVAKKNTRKI